MTDPRVELKALPCPFCCSSNLAVGSHGDAIVCRNCSAEGPWDGNTDVLLVTARWNHRAPLPLGVEATTLFDAFYAALPDYEIDQCWSDDELRKAFSIALMPVLTLLEREAHSLNDYANEVSSEMTEAVLRGAAKRLSALSTPALPGAQAGKLPSGDLISGTKRAVTEALLLIWRAEPANDCDGQTWKDFAEKCDLARMAAEQRGVSDGDVNLVAENARRAVKIQEDAWAKRALPGEELRPSAKAVATGVDFCPGRWGSTAFVEKVVRNILETAYRIDALSTPSSERAEALEEAAKVADTMQDNLKDAEHASEAWDAGAWWAARELARRIRALSPTREEK